MNFSIHNSGAAIPYIHVGVIQDRNVYTVLLGF